MSEGGGDKTEAASPKKRADARKEGDTLRSRDLGVALASGTLLLWIGLFGGAAFAGSLALLRDGLAFGARDGARFAPREAMLALVTPHLGAFAALGAALLIAAAASGLLLGGGWQPGAIAPKWSRIDPAKGIKRLIGTEALIGLATSIAKVAVACAILVWLLGQALPGLASLAVMPRERWGGVLGGLLYQSLAWFTALTVIAGAVDVLIQWRRREGRLRMSKQDVRDEHKSSEGSPENKRAQRERQYAIAQSSARKAMATASVVLTNPTHFAVALRYRPGLDAVPMVVARGADEAARAIRDLAAEHGVPTLDSPLLTRAIFFSTPVNQPVASELYLAVATVLAFVFELDAQVAKGRRVPEVVVPEGLRFDGEGRAMR